MAPTEVAEDSSQFVDCVFCLYWVGLPRANKKAEKGECRALPPSVVYGSDVGVWPITGQNDFCAKGKRIS